MNRLVLHIGTEKTGSTSIQSFLSGYLRQESSPFIGPHDSPQLGIWRGNFLGLHWWASQSLPSHRDFATLDQLLPPFLAHEAQRSASTGKISVFSNEHLSRCQPQQANNLVALLGEFFPSLASICYLRPHVDFVLSILSTAYKCGHTRPPEQLVQEFFRDNRAALAHRVWSQAVPGSTIFREFNTATLTAADVIPDFLQALGALAEPDQPSPWQLPPQPIRDNPAIHPRLLGLAAALVQRIHQLPASPQQQSLIRDAALAHLLSLSPSIGEGAFDSQSHASCAAMLPRLQKEMDDRLRHLGFSDYFYDLPGQLACLAPYVRPAAALSSTEHDAAEACLDLALRACGVASP